MSDTPRSDIISHNTMDIPFYEWVYLAACQELERDLSAATARADALQAENERTIKELHKCDDECTRLTVALVEAEKALEAARHEMICASASGCVRLECVDKAIAEARKQGETK